LEQFRLLFRKGVEFANKHPEYAALGEQFSKENNELAKLAVIKEGEQTSRNHYLCK
jgi:TetR/AcrR family transcriptional regulator